MLGIKGSKAARPRKRKVKRGAVVASDKPKLKRIGGVPVRNMKKPLMLEITPHDCSVGDQKKPGSCAAAVAAVRQIEGCVEARIHIGRVFFLIDDSKKKYWLRAKTPSSLRTEIATFDRGGSFEPGIYKINPLPKSDQATGRKQSNSKKTNARTKKRKPRMAPRILKNVRTSGNTEYKS